MSIRQGNNIIAGKAPSGVSLFDFKWADHKLNDVSWLRADTFSWQSSDVYVSAYEHLANDINGKTLQSEVVGNITVQFYLADDGHKICPASEESNLVALYEATDVAWYYILDTDNQQFKLPRTKWGFTGLRDSVGGYVAPGLPDHTHIITMNRTNKSGTDTATVWSYSENRNGVGTVESAGASNPIYGASDTVQPPATQMYLYFWVGAFDQTATEQTAGLNAEMFNAKADIDLGNIPANYDYVIESQLPTADNGYTWYRKYKSGWVEQGGTHNRASSGKVTLHVPMASTPYWITLICYSGAQRYAWCGSLTATSFNFSAADDDTTNNDGTYCWTVRGYAA